MIPNAFEAMNPRVMTHRNHDEILWSVVITDTVEMVYILGWRDNSAQHEFRDHDVFIDVTRYAGSGMIGCKTEDVASRMPVLAALPMGRCLPLPGFGRATERAEHLIGAVLTPGARRPRERTAAGDANEFGHAILPVIRNRRHSIPQGDNECQITIEPLAELAALSGEARKAKSERGER